MVGLPKVYGSKADYYNAVDYAITTDSNKGVVLAALTDLKENVYMNVLKESSKKVPAEEQTEKDYEKVENPNCKKKQLDFTDEEIDALIKKIS